MGLFVTPEMVNFPSARYEVYLVPRPRFVTHIDKDAIESIRNLYAAEFAEADRIWTDMGRGVTT